MLVVDASALGTLVFGEPQTEETPQAISEATLVAPALLWFEMAAVAAKKMRLHPEQASQMRMAFDLAFRLPIVIKEVEYGEIVNLALSSDLTTYDASYLWLADRLGTELVTLDAELAEFPKQTSVRRSPTPPFLNSCLRSGFGLHYMV